MELFDPIKPELDAEVTKFVAGELIKQGKRTNLEAILKNEQYKEQYVITTDVAHPYTTLSPELLHSDQEFFVPNSLYLEILGLSKNERTVIEQAHRFVSRLPGIEDRMLLVRQLDQKLQLDLISQEWEMYSNASSFAVDIIQDGVFDIKPKYSGTLSTVSGQQTHSYSDAWIKGLIESYFDQLGHRAIRINTIEDGYRIDTKPRTINRALRWVAYSSLKRLLYFFLEDQAKEDFETTIARREDLMGELNSEIAVMYDALFEQKKRNDELKKTHENSRQELKQEIRNYNLLCYEDGLTQIPNRKYFNEHFERIWKTQTRKSSSGKMFGLLMCDIDYFKQYNDTYGHMEGDECLRKVAQTINETIRGGDFAAKYGGEEFIVVVSDTVHEDLEAMADRLITSIRDLKIPHRSSKVYDSETSKRIKYVTISVGGALMLPNHSKDRDDLLKEADLALYDSKKNGRNRYTIHTI